MIEYKPRNGTPLCCSPNVDCGYRTFVDDICTSEYGPKNCGSCAGACC